MDYKYFLYFDTAFASFCKICFLSYPIIEFVRELQNTPKVYTCFDENKIQETNEEGQITYSTSGIHLYETNCKIFIKNKLIAKLVNASLTGFKASCVSFVAFQFL